MPIPFEDIPEMRPAMRRVFFHLLDGTQFSRIAAELNMSEDSARTLACRVTAVLHKALPEGLEAPHCVAREFMRLQTFAMLSSVNAQQVEEDMRIDAELRRLHEMEHRTQTRKATA